MVVFILILVTKNKSMTDEKKSIDKRKDNATYEIRKRTEKKNLVMRGMLQVIVMQLSLSKSWSC